MRVPVGHGIPEALRRKVENDIEEENRNAEEGLPADLMAEEESVPEEGLFEEEFQEERIGWSKKQVLILIAIAVLVLLGIGMMALFLPRSEGGVIINEVMTSNDHAFRHPEYGSVDWIELYNPTKSDIDISGFGVTDELKKQYKYTLPEGTVLKSGEYLVLYCTGGTAASDSDPFCTGFALSQEGEALYLINRSYLELDSVTIPYLETDTAYARDEKGTFRTTSTVTPGESNQISESSEN